MPENSITIMEAARRLGVSRATIYNWAKRDDEYRIEMTEDGRVPVAEVEKFLVKPAPMDQAQVARRLAEDLANYAARKTVEAAAGIASTAEVLAQALEDEGLPRETLAGTGWFVEQVNLLTEQINTFHAALQLQPVIEQFRQAAVSTPSTRKFQPEAIEKLRPFMRVIWESEEEGAD